MFKLYTHKRYPEYRLITPHGSTLPGEITDEWALAETANSIEGGLEKEIGSGGYHLYKFRSVESERGEVTTHKN
jgi:hypothetical protein